MMPKNHILLLQDEQGLERILTLLLKQAKFKVTSCHVAKTALSEIISATGACQPNLLIIDVSGPNCEGTKLLKKIKELSINLPLLVLTPYGEEGSIAKLIPIIDNLKLLTTPFEPAELMTCINKITRTSNSNI